MGLRTARTSQRTARSPSFRPSRQAWRKHKRTQWGTSDGLPSRWGKYELTISPVVTLSSTGVGTIFGGKFIPLVHKWPPESRKPGL